MTRAMPQKVCVFGAEGLGAAWESADGDPTWRVRGT